MNKHIRKGKAMMINGICAYASPIVYNEVIEGAKIPKDNDVDVLTKNLHSEKALTFAALSLNEEDI